jgi:hypothetical protein
MISMSSISVQPTAILPNPQTGNMSTIVQYQLLNTEVSNNNNNNNNNNDKYEQYQRTADGHFAQPSDRQHEHYHSVPATQHTG